MLPQWLGNEPDRVFILERAHRTLASAVPNQNRAVLLRFLNYQDKEFVLRSTRQRDITHDGSKLAFVQDFSAETIRRRLITFNVRGLGHPIKRKRVLTFLKKEKVDIAFLQETHLSNEEHKKLKRDWVGQAYFSSFTSNKRGTAILIHKKLPFIFKEQYSDYDGRQILIRGMLYGQELTLLNVYAPNEDNPKFMMDTITLFNQYNTDFGIVAGDFNYG
ncbi:hypothetical protein PO909_026860 [Leuciscus waleckii]